MRTCRKIVRAGLALAIAGAASPAAAQPQLDALVERMRSVEPGSKTAAECDAEMWSANRLNAADLFHGAAVCLAADKKIEGSFLMIAGQVRFTADFLIVPAAKSDADAQIAMYGFIYSFAGGVGDQEIFRRPAQREQFFSLLDNWAPEYGPEYNPGWNDRRRPEVAEYRQAISEARQGRRQQLTDFARLYADDEYYALSRELDELSLTNNHQFVEGTADEERFDELMRRMGERSVALGFPPRGPPPDPSQLEDTSGSFPSPTPGEDEIAVDDTTHPVVRKCAKATEFNVISGESTIVGLSITQDEQWGVIWRADLAGVDLDGAEEVTRFTCTEGTSSSRPLDMGEDDTLAPLPTAPADLLEALVG